MEGWVDLGSSIAAWQGIEPTTAWSQDRRPNRYATKSPNFAADLCVKWSTLRTTIRPTLYLFLVVQYNNIWAAYYLSHCDSIARGAWDRVGQTVAQVLPHNAFSIERSENRSNEARSTVEINSSNNTNFLYPTLI